MTTPSAAQTPGSHLPDGALLALHDGDDALDASHEHVAQCADCRSRLDALAARASAVRRSLESIPVAPLNENEFLRRVRAARAHRARPVWRRPGWQAAAAVIVVAAAAAASPIRAWIERRLERSRADVVTASPSRSVDSARTESRSGGDRFLRPDRTGVHTALRFATRRRPSDHRGHCVNGDFRACRERRRNGWRRLCRLAGRASRAEFGLLAGDVLGFRAEHGDPRPSDRRRPADLRRRASRRHSASFVALTHMALVVFLRGVNVGGHRTFRPSVLANQLERYGVVNVGAAGTFVVRNPGKRTEFAAALRGALPFETHVMLCDARDPVCAFMPINRTEPGPPRRDVVRFVSVLSKASPNPGLAASSTPACRKVARQDPRGGPSLPLRRVSPPHEDDRVPRPDRQTRRFAGDDTQLEHAREDRTHSRG